MALQEVTGLSAGLRATYISLVYHIMQTLVHHSGIKIFKGTTNLKPPCPGAYLEFKIFASL
jgi:hypothetical protein